MVSQQNNDMANTSMLHCSNNPILHCFFAVPPNCRIPYGCHSFVGFVLSFLLLIAPSFNAHQERITKGQLKHYKIILGPLAGSNPMHLTAMSLDTLRKGVDPTYQPLKLVSKKSPSNADIFLRLRVYSCPGSVYRRTPRSGFAVPKARPRPVQISCASDIGWDRGKEREARTIAGDNDCDMRRVSTKRRRDSSRLSVLSRPLSRASDEKYRCVKRMKFCDGSTTAAAILLDTALTVAATRGVK
eukprot:GHVU01201177.1.p1 GENE.GHVU01201177.1~~GHVU01201177.1.p1  ORF type:complete len:243 (-),score=1.49 GHVU01201177.1:264-992(-)